MIQSEDDIHAKLMAAGLRATRQRLLIGKWLFSGENKHFTAEDLHSDFKEAGISVSLATIYNTLGTFVQSNLLRTVSVERDRVYYDTNTAPHYHFYDETRRRLTDFPIHDLELSQLPSLPDDQHIDRIDIIIRTRQS